MGRWERSSQSFSKSLPRFPQQSIPWKKQQLRKNLKLFIPPIFIYKKKANKMSIWTLLPWFSIPFQDFSRIITSIVHSIGQSLSILEDFVSTMTLTIHFPLRFTVFHLKKEILNFPKYHLQKPQPHSNGKVQIFWEGHKNLKKSPTLFDVT